MTIFLSYVFYVLAAILLLFLVVGMFGAMFSNAGLDVKKVLAAVAATAICAGAGAGLQALGG